MTPEQVAALAERDRLAADLHDVAVAAWLDKLMPVAPWPMDKFEWLADRLIDLGWTRLETCDPPCAPCCAEHPHWTHWHPSDPPLDEKRLARAIHRRVCGVTTHRHGFAGECRPWRVALIAKAYREDAG